MAKRLGESLVVYENSWIGFLQYLFMQFSFEISQIRLFCQCQVVVKPQIELARNR